MTEERIKEISKIKCPECDFELEHVKKEHWSGNNDWFRCPRCLSEFIYDLELLDL